MASIQDHPKELTSKSEIQRCSHAHPQTPASPAVSVVSFILCDLRQGSQSLGAAVDSRALEDTKLLQQEHWGKDLPASCVLCHIFIQNPISLILPCLVHPRCEQPSRAGLLVLPSSSDHYKRHRLRIQGFDVHLFPFIFIFTTFPLKSASHRLSYKLSSSVAYEAPNCRQCGMI